MTVMMVGRGDPSGRYRSCDERSDNMMGSCRMKVSEGVDDCIYDWSGYDAVPYGI